jgi:hypothetical protein
LFRGISGLNCRKSRRISSSRNVGRNACVATTVNQETPYPPRQANAHEVDEVVDIDDIIDYTMLNPDGTVDDDNDKGNTTDGDGSLAYMAGHSTLPGDIHKVMATKSMIPNNAKSGSGTSRKVNASKSTPSTIQVYDNTYYLYIGESIEVDGHQYFAHSTNISY